MEAFRAPAAHGDLVGRVVGDGPPLLLLHGGPGLPDYLGPLTEELRDGYTVATYTQRGLSPSTDEGPMDVAAHVADVLAVADHLGWERPLLGGHSWGGHLVLHVLADHADRFAGALVVDPLGAVGDGGMAAFEKDLHARVPEASRPRLAELAALEADTPLSPDLALEQLALLWPAYHPDPDAAPPFPEDLAIAERGSEVWESLLAELPRLGSRLAGCDLPTAFVHGARSPIPVMASTDSATLMTHATVDVVPGAGHFLWYDAPGEVRRSLDALAARLS